jgi:hypothetical protein
LRAIAGFAPTTTRVNARSDSMLVTFRPEPEIGVSDTSDGSSVSHVRGAISTGVCRAVQISSACGLIDASFGVFWSIARAA